MKRIHPGLLAPLVACLAGCARPAAPAASSAKDASVGRALAAVVGPRIASLRASGAGTLGEPMPPGEEERQHLLGLVEMAASSRGKMREVALEEAEGLGERAIAALGELLADEERGADERFVAADLLGRLDDPRASALLVGALSRTRVGIVRAHAAWSLARTSDDRFVPAVLLRLKYEADSEAAGAIALALAHWKCYAGVEALAELARRPPPESAEAARARMEEITRAAGLASGDELVLRWCSPRAGELPQLAPSAALELAVWERIGELSREHFQLRGVDDARYVLSRLEPWALPWLVEALGEEDVYVRLHVAQVLERMGPRAAGAGPALARALDDPGIAPAAAEALGAIGARESLEALLEATAPERALELRVAAVRALGRLADRAAMPALRDLMGAAAEDAELRRVSARTLVALGEGTAVVPALLAEIESGQGDPATAESALERWIVGEAERWGGRHAELASEWRALDTTPPAAIPTAEATAARRRSRAELVRRFLSE